MIIYLNMTNSEYLQFKKSYPLRMDNNTTIYFENNMTTISIIKEIYCNENNDVTTRPTSVLVIDGMQSLETIIKEENSFKIKNRPVNCDY